MYAFESGQIPTVHHKHSNTIQKQFKIFSENYFNIITAGFEIKHSSD